MGGGCKGDVSDGWAEFTGEGCCCMRTCCTAGGILSPFCSRVCGLREKKLIREDEGLQSHNDFLYTLDSTAGKLTLNPAKIFNQVYIIGTTTKSAKYYKTAQSANRINVSEEESPLIIDLEGKC